MFEEVEVLVDTHFFIGLSKTKSSLFLTKVMVNQNVIDVRIFKETWRSLN